MRVALLTYGTRGDVQPFIALARGLQQAGHQVRLAAPERLEALASPYNIPFVPLAGDPATFVQNLIDTAAGNPLLILRTMRDFVFPLAAQVIVGMREACREVDVIVHTFLTTTGGHAIAREQGILDISVQFFPIFAPTGEFASPAFPQLPLGRHYNRFTHNLFIQLFWWGGHIGYNWLKRSHSAFPQQIAWPFHSSARSVSPQLYAFSPTVVPRPNDWGPNVHITGYWTTDISDSWQPPEPLTQFLASQPPPVCINFGSIVSRDVNRVYDAVLAALTKTKQPGVILTGWGGWKSMDIPANVLALEAAPHDWLFPHMMAVIHHGGAGTTAAALRAGVPNIVVPFAADQPFWGQRVAKLKVGPPPIPAKQLHADRLEAAIRQVVESTTMRQRAAEVGRQLRTENGVGQAITIIEQYYNRFGVNENSGNLS
jgi:sterol 3beta-glucosyltransferase